MKKKNCGTGLVPAKSTGTGPELVPAQIPPEPVPDLTGTGIPVESNRNSHFLGDKMIFDPYLTPNILFLSSG